jgi:hypothetical protein
MYVPTADAWARNDVPVILDALDDRVWGEVVELASVARGGDRYAFVRAVEGFSQKEPLSEQRLAGLYALYLLKLRVISLLGRKPTTDDLAELALTHQDDFRSLAPGPKFDLLLDVLRTAFVMNPAGLPEGPGAFFVGCLIAMAVLTEEPARDLAELKPSFARWCEKHAAHIASSVRDEIPKEPSPGG